ncbi:hypothetical protein GCM10009867_17910 [Pedococcus aerophilus]|uniref:Uncharacterized protein n=1 Tax=Pedococcus aerophilus TaxID=436356 RepID=A0ABP6H1W1_9MICO
MGLGEPRSNDGGEQRPAKNLVAAQGELARESWESRFAEAPGPESPFHTPPPRIGTLRWAVVIHVVVLLVVAGALTAGFVQNNDGVLARIGLAALGAVLVAWRLVLLRTAVLALRRRSGRAGSNKSE